MQSVFAGAKRPGKHLGSKLQERRAEAAGEAALTRQVNGGVSTRGARGGGITKSERSKSGKGKGTRLPAICDLNGLSARDLRFDMRASAYAYVDSYFVPVGFIMVRRCPDRARGDNIYVGTNRVASSEYKWARL